MIGTRRFLILGLALGAMALGSATPARAQNALLYEVTEHMKLKSTKTRLVREATASLLGWLVPGSALCPAPLAQALAVPACGLTATAKDKIDLGTGQGPVGGKFVVVVPGDNAADGPELAIVEGSLQGTIDLSPAVLGPDGIPETGDEAPLGTIRGTWKARGVPGGPLAGLRVGGTFSGMFRLPFALPGVGPAYLLNPYTFPAPGSFVPVEADEHSIGLPAVRLELAFVEVPAAASGDK
jgi:hypothetical protein